MKGLSSLAIGVVLVLAAGCGSNSDQGGTTAPTQDLTGTTWDLVSVVLDGEPGKVHGTASISFDADKKLAVDTGCNSYTGTWSADASTGEISMNAGAGTEMACESDLTRQETLVTDGINGAASYTISGNELTINDSSGTEQLRYESASAQ